MRLVTLAIVVAAVLFGVEAAAVQEQQLPYSGVALTPSGAPVADGLHQMEFRLYTGATASEPVWTELQLVQTRSGSYQVVLGQSRPLPLTTGQQYWLEVLCDGASLGRMPLALLPSQVETKVAARSLQELHLNPVQSAAPNGWVRAGLPTLGGATPPQPLVVNTCEECTTTFWALTGNAGTNPNNNFLGTTDNQPLIIRTNNVNRVRITTGGQIEVLNSARSVSLGEGAGISQDLTAFRNNVFVGFQAGSATETGIRNVAVGSGALSQNIDGSSNTALGSNAMSTLTTGDYNTAIGYGAEVGDGLTNATAIGAFAFAGQSNTVVIGSIQGVNGATATANVGIGTTTPMNRLHVVSTADPLRLEGLLVNSALDNVLVVDASGVVKKRSLSGFVGSTAWLLTGNTLSGGEVLGSLNSQPLVLVTDNTERVRITETGDVGIGTSTPAARLDVVNPTRGGVLRLQAVVGQTGALLEWVDDQGNTLGVIDNSGLVGIGTDRPVQKLHVEGNGSVSAVFVEGGVGVGTVNPLATLHVYDEGTALGATKVIIQAGANQGTENLLEWQDNSGTILGVIDAGGLVGIGTSAPAATLHIYDERTAPGTGATKVIIQAGANQAGENLLEWQNAGGMVLGRIDAAGNLFVNTNTTLGDAATDVVVFNARVQSDVVPSADNMYDLGENTTPLRWRSGYFGTSVVVGTSVSLVAGTPDRLEYSGDGIVRTSGYLAVETGGAERLRVTAAGDVGIGTSTPAATLDVVGTAQVSGNTSIGGSLTVSGTTVSLPNIPSVPTATEVLVWNAGNVGRSTASGLISGFAWALTGNSGTDPAVNFLGTTDAQPLVIRTANVERLRVTAAGDVGIGTSTPAARLDVVNPTRGGVLRLQAVVGQTGALLEWVDDQGNTLGVIDNSGLVGIGTDRPVQKLHVEGNGSVSAVFVEGGVGVGTVNPLATLHVYDEGTALGATKVIIQAGANQGTENLLEWQDNSGTILGVIDAGGLVGIGTSAPAATLHIYDERTAPGTGATKVIIQAGANQAGENLLEWQNAGGMVLGRIDAAGNLFVNTNTTLGDAATDVVVFNARVQSDVVPSADNMYDLGENTTPLRWRSGYFGTSVVVGTSVSLVAGTPDRLEYSGDGIVRTSGYLAVETGGAERLRVTAAGDVGIGTSTPAATLDVVGTAQVSGNTSIGGSLTVSGTTVSLPNIPSVPTATEVLVWNAGNVERSTASGLISGFAWMLGGNTLTSEQTLGTLSAHDLPIITAGTEKVRITQAGHVLPGADNAYDLGENTTPLRWRSGYFGTSVVVGTSVSLVAGTPDRLEYSGDGIVRTSGYLAVETGGAERLRVTAAGEVVVQNQAGGTPTTVLRVLGGNNGAGATQVILQAGTNQTGVNLLEWQDNLGNILGVIDAGGRVGIGTSTPAATLDVVGTAQVSGNTSIGGSLTVSGTTVSLPNIPSVPTATEVLVWNAGNVERSTASGLISGFAWMLGGNDLTALGEQTLGTQSNHDLPIITNNVERLRVTAAGEVVVQNQEPSPLFGPPTRTVLRVLGGDNGAGATQVILQAGNGQTGVNLLEWRDNTGQLVGFIDDAGFVAIGDVNDPGFTGPYAYLHVYSNAVQPAAIFERGVVGIGTGAPLIGGPVLQVVGENPGVAAARFEANVGSTPLELQGVPPAAPTDEVLRIDPATGEVKKSTPTELISGFAWMLGGNDLTALGEQTLGTLSAHDLPIITAGTERVRITQAGDVGIGTSTPGARLHVVGTGRFDGQLTVTAGGAAITGNSTVTGTLTVSSDVSVGGNLAVTGDATVSGTTVALPNIPSVPTATEVLVWNAGNVERSTASGLISGFAWMLGGNDLTALGEQTLGTLSAHDLPIITAGTERVRITQAGDVGIGTSTPGARLHVVGTGRFDGQLTVTAGGAAITGNSTVTGTLTVSSDVSVGGNLAVTGDATVSGTTVALPNIPSVPTATEVLVWNAGNVERSTASGLISGFAWMLGGNDLTALGEQTLGTQSNHDLPIITNNVERMRVRATGEVVVQNQEPSPLFGPPTRTVLRVLGGDNGAGATQVILQAGNGQTGVNLLEWRDNTGQLVGFIDDAGFVAIGDVNAPGFTGPHAYVHVYSNTVEPAAIFERGVVGIGTGAPLIGGPVLQVVGENPGVAAARFEANVGSTPLELQGVPPAAPTDEVLRIDPATGEVKKSTASGLISGFAWMLGGNDLTALGEQTLGTQSNHDLPIITNNVERMRVRATGEVVVQNQEPSPLFGPPTRTVLRVLGGDNGAGATQVILQAGNGQTGVNLLEWRDNTGQLVGFIDDAGFVAIGDVNAPGFTGPHAYVHVYSNTVEPAAIFERGVVGIGTGNPVIGGPVLQVVGENPGVAAARFEANVGSTPLELQGVPPAAPTDEVLRIDPATGEVKKSTASGLISGFAWMLGGNDLTALGEQTLGTQSNHDLPIITNNVERMRVRATGEVVVQNQEPSPLFGPPTRTVLRVLGGDNGAGATQVILQAGNGQTGVNLLEWRDNTGQLVGFIDDAGFVAIGDVNAPGFTGPHAYVHVYSNTVEPAAIFERGVVGIGTGAPLIGGPVLQVVGENPGVAAARFEANVGSTPLELQGVPPAAPTDEVLRIDPATGEVKKSTASGLISGFAWMLGGNDLTALGEQTLGTQSNHDLPIITNNVERMRVRATGEVVVQNQEPSPLFGPPTRTVLRVLGGDNGAGATQVILQAGNGQTGVNLLEWRDNTGQLVGFIDDAGFVAIGDVNAPGFTGPHAYVHVYSNTVEPAAIFERGVVGIGTGNPVIGGPVLQVVGENPGVAAARFEANVGSTPLELQGVPPAAPTDEVLRIDPATGEVKKSTASGLISGFAWMLGGNDLTALGEQTLGTQSNHDLPIITNNVERMRVRATGEVVVQNQEPSPLFGPPTRTVLRVLGGDNGAGATQVILQAGNGQTGVNLLEWRDNTGQLVGFIDDAGFVAIGDVNAPGFTGPHAYVHVYSNTVEPAAIFERGVVGIGTGAPLIGGPVLQVVGENPGVAAARFEANVGSTPLELQGVPPAAPTDEVLRIDPATGEVKKSTASGLISGFAWMLGGNDLTALGEQTLGTQSNHDLPIITNNVERMRVRATGEVVVQNQEPSPLFGPPTRTVLRVLGGDNGAGATQVILQAGNGQTGVNLLEWRDNTGQLVGFIDDAGFVAIGDVNAPGFTGPHAYVHVYSNTVEPAAIFERGVVGIGTGAPLIGGPVLQVVGENPGVAAARFEANVGSTPLELQGVPPAAPTDEVLRIDPATGEVKKSTASGLISGFAWMLGGNDLTALGEQTLGTQSNHDLPIITNNVERMRVRATGEVVVQNQEPSPLFGPPTRTVLRVLGGDNGAGATQVILQAGNGQTGVNLLEWRDNTGQLVGFIDDAGFVAIGDVNAPGFTGPHAYVHVYSNTVEPAAIFERGVVGIGTGNPVIGGPVLQVVGENPGVAAARFEANVGSTPLELQGVPPAAPTDEVLRIDPATGEVKKSTASGLISGFAWMLGGNDLTALGEQTLGTQSNHDLPIITNNVERMRVRATGEVVVQNQEPSPLFGPPTRTVLRVLGGDNGAGATQVILQAGNGQTGVNLLEWRDNTGQLVGFIDDAGFVAIGDVNAPGFTGPHAYVHVYSNTVEPAAIFERGVVGIGTGNPVIGGPVLQVVGENPGVAAARFEANVGSTPLELQGVPPAAPTDEVLRINTATGEVTRSTVAAIISAGIIKGSFPIAASGSSFTISVAPADIQPGAIVTVTLVGPSGGTIYPLMVTNVDDANDEITVESSATIPGGAGYAIHYIIINP